MKTELSERLKNSIIARLTKIAIKYLYKLDYNVLCGSSQLDKILSHDDMAISFLFQLGIENVVKTDGGEVAYFTFFDRDLEKLAVVDNGE